MLGGSVAARELVIVGGANGAGKTTFAVKYASRHHLLYLGADAIASELAPSAPETVPVAAGLELMRRLEEALSNQEAVVLEIHAGRSHTPTRDSQRPRSWLHDHDRLSLS